MLYFQINCDNSITGKKLIIGLDAALASNTYNSLILAHAIALASNTSNTRLILLRAIPKVVRMTTSRN